MPLIYLMNQKNRRGAVPAFVAAAVVAPVLVDAASAADEPVRMLVL